MYIPKSYEITDVAPLHGLMRAYPLGTLVTATRDGLDANHVPFLLDGGSGEHGTLRAHVARANPVWPSADGTEALVIFQGPDAYISPSWYATTAQTGQVVPTWNYVTVHARGVIRVVDERGWLRAHVEALTTEHERGRPAAWSVADAPSDYLDRLLGAIVGLEIPIGRLEGKWKVSQNRPVQDRLGVVDGLGRDGTARARAMADLVRGSLAGG